MGLLSTQKRDYCISGIGSKPKLIPSLSLDTGDKNIGKNEKESSN
jgi:hypothetical protein